MVSVPSFPLCIDFLPDGRLLLVDSARRLLLRREPGGSLGTHADLSGISDKPGSHRGRRARQRYVNSIGFDFPGGQFALGLIALVTPDGAAREVADGLAFPNGMASARTARR